MSTYNDGGTAGSGPNDYGSAVFTQESYQHIAITMPKAWPIVVPSKDLAIITDALQNTRQMHSVAVYKLYSNDRAMDRLGVAMLDRHNRRIEDIGALLERIAES